MQIHGPVLTHCYNLADVAACINVGGYNALKVITGWGSPTGWHRQSMTEVAHMVPCLVVRTVSGDPSYNNGALSLPEAGRIVQEIAPWYTVRSDIYIEIGNEPNRAGWNAKNEQYCWDYRWHLDKTIRACRDAFPRAKLIAPALLLQPDTAARRWLEISESQGPVMTRCDLLGVHIYEHDAWLKAEQRHGTTGQLAQARTIYPECFGAKPWIITEYGINDPATADAVKGQRYAAFAHRQQGTPALPPQCIGALYYHYCADRVIDPQYHIAPAGDVAYKRARDGR